MQKMDSEMFLLVFAALLIACSKGQIVFLLEPKNVSVFEGMDAFFPCTYEGTTAAPRWRITNVPFVTNALPSRYLYNGSGLVVRSVDLSLNTTSYSCFFTVYQGRGELTDIESATGFLNTVPVIIPSSYTAYLGEPSVTFHCFAANASNIDWRVNNMSLSASEMQTRGITTTINHILHESNFTITSTIGNNNTHIECLSDTSLNFHVSETIFYVQGVPGECHDVQIISFGRNHQRLTWNPPSTLNITILEPDISSYIVCSNISTECSTIDVTEAGRDSSHLRQYIFPNLRAYIKFTVIAVNIVGVGEGTSVLYGPCEQLRAPERFATQDLSAVVTFATENKPTMLIEMRSHRNCFDVYEVRLESVEQERGGSRHFQPEVIESGQSIPTVSSDGTLTLNVTTTSTLSTNTLYRATLFTAMDMMEAGSIQFSTYDVQGVDLHGGIGNISIQCEFASGSQARGCHVMIRNSSPDKITSSSMNITRNSSSQSHTAEQTVTGLIPGNYEVCVFDWESDGSLSSTPSYVAHVNVTGLNCEVDTSTTSDPPTTTAPPTQWTAIVCGSVILTLLFIFTMVTFILVLYCKNHRKKKLNGTGSTPKELTRMHFGSTNEYSIASITNTSSNPSGNLEGHHFQDSTE